MTPQEILDFWFKELEPQQWFQPDPALDQLITQRFQKIHQQATCCELYPWRSTAQGRLAEVLILDQFSRNIYRGQAQAFSADPLALALAQEAVQLGLDQELAPEQRAFLYLPYMHSESAKIHEVALKLFAQPGLETNLKFEIEHKEIIDRFGRYPHRNKALGRASTPEEAEFLKTHAGF